MEVYLSIVHTFAGIKKIIFTIFERNFGIYILFCIFVKKQSCNLFLSIGRVKIFSSESRKFFVKKQPYRRDSQT